MRIFAPFAYTARVKRPQERYILHGVVGYDLAVGCLAYANGSPNPLATAFCLTLYLISFFAAYEIGYWENDRLGLRNEAAPRVSDVFRSGHVQFSGLAAWLWAIVFAALGVAAQAALGVSSAILGPITTAEAAATQFGLMSALLIAIRATFCWFNHTTVDVRLVPMIFLQLARTIGYAVLLPISLFGAVLCVSHALSRWIAYVIYRSGGDRGMFPAHLATALIFLAIVVPLSFLALPSGMAWQGQTLIAAYVLFRAGIDLRKMAT